MRLPRTRRGPRAQNELGQHEPGNDEATGDEREPIDGAEKAERRNEGTDLEPTPHRDDSARVSAAWPGKPSVTLFERHAEERDGAGDRDCRATDHSGDGERLGGIAREYDENHGEDRGQSDEPQDLFCQRSSVSPRESIRRGRATCSLPAAIGACASVSIALEARDSARSVSSNFFVAFSR